MKRLHLRAESRAFFSLFFCALLFSSLVSPLYLPQSAHAASADEEAEYQKNLVKIAIQLQGQEDALKDRALHLQFLYARSAHLRGRLEDNLFASRHLRNALLRMARAPGAALSGSADEQDAKWTGAGLARNLIPILVKHAEEMQTQIRDLSLLSQNISAEEVERRVEFERAQKLYAAMQSLHVRILLKRKIDEKIARRAEILRKKRNLKGVREGALTPLPNAKPPAAPNLRLFSLIFPTSGQLIRLFGEKTFADRKAEGITFETPTRAQIVSPSDGRILYAAPVEGFRNVLILAAREGYHILLAGLHELSGRAGQTVREGEPVGRMGQGHAERLYMELREGRKSINPVPFLSRRPKTKGSPT